MSNTIESDTTTGRGGTGRSYAAGAIFVLLLVAYLVNAMDRQVFPVLLVAVRNDYGFSTTEAGLQSTIFALGIGVLGLPSGYHASPGPAPWSDGARSRQQHSLQTRNAPCNQRIFRNCRPRSDPSPWSPSVPCKSSRSPHPASSKAVASRNTCGTDFPRACTRTSDYRPGSRGTSTTG